MQSMALKINHLLEGLEEEDFDKAVSYIEFLVSDRKKKKAVQEALAEEKEDVEAIVRSLTGIIPGKTLEDYRNERLKKYEIPD